MKNNKIKRNKKLSALLFSTLTVATFCIVDNPIDNSSNKAYAQNSSGADYVLKNWSNYPKINHPNFDAGWAVSGDVLYTTKNIHWTGFWNSSDKEATDRTFEMKLRLNQNHQDPFGWTFRHREIYPGTFSFYAVEVGPYYNEISLVKINSWTPSASDEVHAGPVYHGIVNSGDSTAYNAYYRQTRQAFALSSVNGNFLASAPISWSYINWHSLKIENIGNRIRVWFNETLVIDYVDNSNPLTYGGYGPYTASQYNAEFKDIFINGSSFLNVPPQISVSSPTAYSTYNAGTAMYLSGTIYDPDNRGTMSVKYSIDNGAEKFLTTIPSNSNPQAYGGNILLPSNLSIGTHTLQVWGVDSENGFSPKQSIPFVVRDSIPPNLTLSQNITNWTNQSVTVSAVASDNVAVQRIQLPNGNWVAGSSASYLVEANGSYQFIAEDTSGNRAPKAITISNIDKIKPFTPSLEIDGVENTWVNRNVLATIRDNGDEGGSGFRVEYSLSGAINETWRKYTSPVFVKNDGITVISGRVVDNAGNISSVVSKTIKIDQNPPEIIVKPNIKNLTNTDIILNIKAEDLGSGVKHIQLPNGNWINSDVVNYTVSENGTYTFKAEDNFGHVSSVDFIVKNIKRDVLITPIPEVDLELHAEDRLSGVTEMRFKNEEGAWSNWESYKPFNEWVLEPVNGLKHVWVQYRDKVGNVTEAIEDIIILDMTKPIASFLKINNGATYTRTKSVTLDLKGSDAYTGVEDMYLSNDNVTWVKYPYTERVEDWILSDVDGIKTVYLKISDKAGNISDVITDTIFLDTTKPFANIAINNGDSFTPTRDVMLTLTYSDVGGSGVNKIKVMEGDREYTLPAPTPNSPVTIPWTLDFGVVRTVSIVVTDRAGNVSNIVSDTIIVDKLTIKQFTLENLINPLVYNKNKPFQEKVWAFEPQKMIAGGDITFSMDIKQAIDVDVVNDSIDYKVEVVGDSYHQAFTGEMRKARDHYTQTITIPKDTPNGAKVYVTATAKRILNVSPYDTQIVYFPGGEDASQKALIGVVEGNIYDAIRFNETQ